MNAADPAADRAEGPAACPVADHGVQRRSFLRGAGLGTALGAGALAGAFTAAGAMADDGAKPGPSGRTVPFHGPHQAGITTAQQGVASFVSFSVIAADRAGLQQLLSVLTDRVRFLTAGGPVPATDLASPPTDSATLGPVLPSDGLTVTVGLGASLFDQRFGLADRKPAKLVTMPAFPDDDLTGSTELHGDLSLQICADSRDTVMHALRDITRHTRGLMQPSWKVDGFKAAPRPTGTPRNQLGFRDGIANPNAGDGRTADALIWTHGGANGEPAWAEGGSYQVVRIIRMLVEFWDRVSLHEQEQMIGRRRDSGAPLDGTTESDQPNYQADQQGLVIPMTAHIRLANPRTPDSFDSQILRRSYNYERGLDLNGNLDIGLVFCCYQQDVERQFQAVQQRLAGEPLVDYISPTGGGYFFALPGVKGPNDTFGSALLA
ncbi:iron uptake transporter deferrochelatase/peroxidase subunit [Kitasatospora viridis]|uniref:Deferrochelatase n=1 Tax=Kitasatospora viridis TaxID=281105 RepID=A0A561T6H5_9ACTN|nr:iron uptake transporter deferrochelatase/peroxidase subunit [Kitasatospora viridis]TWF82725.1 deferrochelatase/peroxidase EfeB [Kitasatospora viridis]